MNEIEKMYENAGMGKEQHCTKAGNCYYPECTKCDYYNYTCYPPFTTEKQLLLLQWIVNKTDLYLHRHKTDFTYSIASGDIAVNKNKDFKESIAEFINTTWQDLTEEEKQQVKGILE